MSLKLIDAVESTLVADEAFMAFFGLTPESEPEDIVKRLIKGMEPDEAITAHNVPLCLIYDKPGRFGGNYLVYEGKFCLDVYAKTAYQAKLITERAFELFHDRLISDDTFHSYRCMCAFDSDFATGIKGVKGREIIFDVDFYRGN